MPAYDIVVFGASGFTGNLVLRYLATVATGIQWAVAGRSKVKVQKALQDAGVSGVPVLVADAADEASLLAMAKQTRLVISLVGPYTLYGSTLVRVCSANGVHYVDLTGEASFVRDMVRANEASALETKALIIHSCGFDSVPSDLCALLAIQRLKTLAGANAQVGEVSASFQVKGGPSGGTLASVLVMLESGIETKKTLMDPFALSPIPATYKPKPVFVTSQSYEGKKTFGAFWVMASHNSAIVFRSAGLVAGSALAYGPGFKYEESLLMPNPVVAAITSVMFYFGFAMLALFPPARWALRKFGPSPGEGPSVEAQRTGYFKVVTVASTVDKKQSVQVVMKGKGDPGYSGTAIMIVECALSIVRDFDRLPVLAKAGGFLTPATALGQVLVERLEKTGTFSFSAEDSKTK